jgi:hypothetical protein
VGREILGRAVTKLQVALLLVVLLMGAAAAFFVIWEIALAPTSSSSSSPTPSATLTPSSPTPTPTATIIPISSRPLTVVSARLIIPYNPGGSTIEIILQNNGTSPVVNLQAVLTLSGRNYTYVFNVSENNPLLPSQETSQQNTLINAGFQTNQTYPIQITGKLQSGASFNFTTLITIAQSNQLVGSGTKGDLELTMTIDKSVYSFGEPINLTLTITNISQQTINFTHTGLDFDFQVTNDTNNLVYQWSNFKFIPQFMSTEELPAGGIITSNFTWPQICNFNTQVEGDAAAPGTYFIIGQTGSTYNIQTNPIQITILEP